MNHDYAHCADFKETCPMDCFRAQLVRDLKNNPQRFTSWIHFSDTDECPLDKYRVKCANTWIGDN